MYLVVFCFYTKRLFYKRNIKIICKMLSHGIWRLADISSIMFGVNTVHKNIQALIFLLP